MKNFLKEILYGALGAIIIVGAVWVVILVFCGVMWLFGLGEQAWDYMFINPK